MKEQEIQLQSRVQNLLEKDDTKLRKELSQTRSDMQAYVDKQLSGTFTDVQGMMKSADTIGNFGDAVDEYEELKIDSENLDYEGDPLLQDFTHMLTSESSQTNEEKQESEEPVLSGTDKSGAIRSIDIQRVGIENMKMNKKIKSMHMRLQALEKRMASRDSNRASFIQRTEEDFSSFDPNNPAMS